MQNFILKESKIDFVAYLEIPRIADDMNQALELGRVLGAEVVAEVLERHLAVTKHMGNLFIELVRGWRIHSTVESIQMAMAVKDVRLERCVLRLPLLVDRHEVKSRLLLLFRRKRRRRSLFSLLGGWDLGRPPAVAAARRRCPAVAGLVDFRGRDLRRRRYLTVAARPARIAVSAAVAIQRFLIF